MFKRISNNKKIGYLIVIFTIVLILILYFVFTGGKNEWGIASEPPPKQGTGLIVPDDTWNGPTNLPKR